MNKLGPYQLEANQQGQLSLVRETLGKEPVAVLYFTLRFPQGEERILTLTSVTTKKKKVSFTTSKGQPVIVHAELEYLTEKDALRFKVELAEDNLDRPVSVRAVLESIEPGEPRWMVPGIFYGMNRPAETPRIYPGFRLGKAKPEEFWSNYWSFFADRCAHPSVFCWTARHLLYVGTEEHFAGVKAGIFFRGDGEKVELGVDFPGREEPQRYCFFPPQGQKPMSDWLTITPGTRAAFSFDLALRERDPHGYASMLRAQYYEERERNPLHPWMKGKEAMELLAYGLYHWHYDPGQEVIFETASFDKYFGNKGGYSDRRAMHTAWISGITPAYALLWYARQQQHHEYARAAQQVLDNIAGNSTPMGTFWGAWSEEKGWYTGWNPSPDWLHARTLAEAALFMIRAIRMELHYDVGHPEWAEAVQRTLDYVVRVQREDGNPGSYYDVRTGKVARWEGTAGLLWIAALVAGGQLWHRDRYLSAAVRAADYYARFVEDEFLYGAPEDIPFAPSSEDGYNAVISYLMLYQFNRFARWLELARRAADWTLSFRFGYNVHFSPRTILGKYDYRTRGGDIASPVNQHLHNYGLICYPEFLRLALYTDDNYYVERARDNLMCFLQFIAREDGDFGARKGMMSEQWYHTDWWQPKGHLLQLSHASCLGLTLFALLYQRHHDEQVLTTWHGSSAAEK